MLAAALAACAPASGSSASFAPTLPPGTALALHIVGNHFVDAANQPVQLLGVNVSGGGDCIPIKRQPFGTLYPLTQVSAQQTAMAIASWHATIVRVTLNEDCWLGINGVAPTYSGNVYRTAITSFIALLHTYGLYAIVDLHINAPGSLLATSQQVMADADHALMFWQSVATTFKGDPGVIFEAYNEPHITLSDAETSNPWACWQEGCTVTVTDQNQNQPIPGAVSWQSVGMQQIVTAIRATGATNPILVGGLNWSQDLTGLLQHLPTDPQHQLAAAYHNYMSIGSRNTLAYWNQTIAPIAQSMPVVTTEMGEKDGGSSFNTEYMTWADAHGVSYIPWAWGPSSAFGALALLASWDGTPSTYGQAFYDHFHALHSGAS
jgi:endoglucanase